MSTPLDALVSTATVWGSSRLTELQRCPQAHHLRYAEGIEPKRKAVYFDIGSYVHACLRWVNEGTIACEPEPRDWRLVIAAAREKRDAMIAEGTAEPVPWDEIDPIDEAERLVGPYYASHGPRGWPEGVRLLHVERPLRSDRLRATACADLIVDVGGEIVIPDTKTRKNSLPKGADRADFEREQRTTEEFLRLSALLQEEWKLPEPPAVWLDAIIKTKVPTVDRLLVRFTQRDIDEWRENAAKLVQHAELSARHGLPVVRNYHECRPPIGAGRCWAFDWCHGSDETRERRYRRREEQQS